LLPRKRTAHKGDFGHIVVIGGDYGMSGAVRMSAEAALRAGAGLVSVVTRPEHVLAINASRPEIMAHGIGMPMHAKKLLAHADVIIIGPGLGKSFWSKGLFKLAVATNKPMIIDADALNLLAEKPLRRNDWILTPHPGEAARLLHKSKHEIQANRCNTARDLQRKFGGVCILKGAGTIVANSTSMLNLCNAGNPGMASGGMGDILSGIIGGLVAQKISANDAANLAVGLHATAGDQAAKKLGERGLLALDLMPYIHLLVN
jgi:ADP-dependent NAD(P)H-hydrate dehydratase / NAD(P)H-hydrate epimerase